MEFAFIESSFPFPFPLLPSSSLFPTVDTRIEPHSGIFVGVRHTLKSLSKRGWHFPRPLRQEQYIGERYKLEKRKRKDQTPRHYIHEVGRFEKYHGDLNPSLSDPFDGFPTAHGGDCFFFSSVCRDHLLSLQSFHPPFCFRLFNILSFFAPN